MVSEWARRVERAMGDSGSPYKGRPLVSPPSHPIRGRWDGMRRASRIRTPSVTQASELRKRLAAR